jgi:hypothetical protein
VALTTLIRFGISEIPLSPDPNPSIFPASRLTEVRLAIVTCADHDAVDADGAVDRFVSDVRFDARCGLKPESREVRKVPQSSLSLMSLAAHSLPLSRLFR